MTIHLRRRDGLAAIVSGSAVTDAVAAPGNPIGLLNPVGAIVLLLLVLVFGLYVREAVGRFAKAGQRRVEARGRRARIAALDAERPKQLAEMARLDQVLAETRRRVALIERLMAFLRELPLLESAEVALPKIDAFRRSTGEAEALLGADADRLFQDAADKAFELFVQRGRIRDGHEGRPVSPHAGTHGSAADILQWFVDRSATAEDELAPLVESRSGLARSA